MQNILTVLDLVLNSELWDPSLNTKICRPRRNHELDGSSYLNLLSKAAETHF